jgi:hypothetical protein
MDRMHVTYALFSCPSIQQDSNTVNVEQLYVIMQHMSAKGGYYGVIHWSADGSGENGQLKRVARCVSEPNKAKHSGQTPDSLFRQVGARPQLL